MNQQNPDSQPDFPDRDMQTLFRAAQGGCQESAAKLVERCRDYLLAIANRNIESGLRPKVAASDAVQDTLIEAQRDLPGFRGASEQELLAWMRRILEHNLTDARRKYFETRKRQLGREQPLGDLKVPATRESATASGMVAKDEEAERVRMLVQALPEDYRTVIELRNWQLKSFEQIGVEMQRSAEAARKLWGRAVAQLQEQLGKSDHDSRGTC